MTKKEKPSKTWLVILSSSLLFGFNSCQEKPIGPPIKGELCTPLVSTCETVACVDIKTEKERDRPITEMDYCVDSPTYDSIVKRQVWLEDELRKCKAQKSSE